MKNIKSCGIFFVLIFLSQFIFAQGTEDMKFKVKVASKNTVKFSWSNKKDYRGFHVQVKKDGQNVWENLILSTGESFETDKLSNNTGFQVRLAAYNNLNDGPTKYSPVEKIKTANISIEKQQKGKINNEIKVNIKTVGKMGQNLIIDWNMVGNNKFYFVEVGESEKDLKILSKQEFNNFVAANLKPYTKYFVRIAILEHPNAEINSYSKINTFTTGINDIDKTQKPKFK